MLSAKEMFQLCTLVLQEYASSNMTDVLFAEYAKGKLGFPVRFTNVATAREVHSIPTKKALAMARNKEKTKLTVLQRIEILERRMDAWEK